MGGSTQPAPTSGEGAVAAPALRADPHSEEIDETVGAADVAVDEAAVPPPIERKEARGLARFLPPVGQRGGIVAFAVLVVFIVAMPYLLRFVFFDNTLGGQRKAANYLALLYGGMIFSIAAVGLGVLIGYTGLLSLGHAGFLGVGGYTMAMVATNKGLNPWLTLVLVVLLAAAIGGVLGMISVGLRGFYFTVMTLVFLSVGFAFTTIFVSLTGGSNGRRVESRLVTERMTAFGYYANGARVRGQVVGRVGDRAAFYLLVAVFLFATILLVKSLIHSRFGRAFQAIRESETASQASGISTYRFKVYAVMISAVFVGVAGALLVQDPQVGQAGQVSLGVDGQPILSFFLVTMNVIGGLGTIAGPVLGSLGFKIIPDLLLGSSGAQNILPLVTSLGIVIGVVVAPWGTVGAAREARNRRQLRKTRAGPPIIARVKQREGDGSDSYRRTVRRYTITAPAIPEPAAEFRRPSVAQFPGRAGDAVLELGGMGKRFGGLQALNTIDLSVERGTIHAVIGPNGSGKTTLINCVTGFYRPSSGRILLRGHDISEEAAYKRARVGVARTFQNLQIWRRLSVVDNVRIGGHVRVKADVFSSMLRLPWMRKEEAVLLERSWGMLHFMGLAQRGFSAAGA